MVNPRGLVKILGRELVFDLDSLLKPLCVYSFTGNDLPTEVITVE